MMLGDLSDTRPYRLYELRGEPAQGCAYVVLFEDMNSRVRVLAVGERLLIGRCAESDIILSDIGISRRHATLLECEDGCWLEDAGSHNGTYVNGERIDAPRRLSPGDVIGIGPRTLIFHRTREEEGHSPKGPDRLRRRLAEEIDRCVRYQRQLALLCLRPVQEGRMEPLLAGVAHHLREMDMVSYEEGRGALVLLPEISVVEAARLAARLIGDFEKQGMRIHVGLACCPLDGHDGEALISGACSAAGAAAPGALLTAAMSATTVMMGDQALILAEPAMLRAYDRLRRCAATALSVMILGETGVGKEVAARALHAWSPRSARPFVVLNCAALPESLAESELFGHQRGAFTGAVADKQGLLEAAQGGTLFLDEVGELSLAVQAKLLRALDTRRVQRVGGLQERAVDIRIVCATNRNLREDVAAGRFRQDLYFRLRGGEILLPPLRERRRELPLLSQALLLDACARCQRPPMTISAAAMHQLLAYSWPGNVRELRSIMDYAAATSSDSVLLPAHLQECMVIVGPPKEARPAVQHRFRPLEDEIRELERRRIMEALTATGFIQARAAELLSVPDKTFRMKVKQYNILTRPPKAC